MSSEKRKDNQEIKKENQSKKIEKINQKITKNILEKDVNQQENHSGKLSFFGKGKNKNSTKKIKNNFSVWNNVEPKYIGIGILIIIILAILAYFLFGRFSPYMDIGYDGYALNDKVTKNLKQNNTDKATQVLDMVKVNDGSTIYKKVASYFVGTPNEKGKSKKEAIDIEYPIYINQNIALYTISKNTKLITNNFEEVKGYQNSTLSDGILYNSSNLSRADSNNYIFIKNSDNIIANLKEAEIKTTANSYKIKINSQINFNKDFINYYELSKVGGRNSEDKSTSEGSTQNSTNDSNKSADENKDNNTADTSNTNNTDDSNTKTLTTETADKLIFRTIRDIDDNTKVIIDGQELSYPEFLKKLGIDKEKKANSKEVVGNKVDNSTNNSTVENTISNKGENTVKNDTENSNTNVEDLSNNQNTNTENNENAEKQEDPNAYKEPEVSVTDFTAEVYTAKGTLTINDPSHALLNGITFMIEKNGKTYQRLLASSSGEVQIQGLEPETRYTIKGSYKFKNADGKTEEKTFYTGEFTTKDTSSLGNIKLKFENGDIYATKIEVKNIKIENDLNEEVIKGISKLELEIDGLKYRLKQSQIREILQGKEFTYQTSETVKSNSKIKYTFHAYDKAGNELKIEAPEGETKTAKQDPKVSISTKKQDITNVVLDLKLTNKDNVELQKYRYVIYDSLDNKVDEGTLNENQKEIKKDNMDPNKYFKIEIYANYDTDNGKGIQENVLIGKGVFTTLPISSLGYLNLDTSMLELHQEDAKVSIKINTDRTDPRLINILHSFKVTITEDPSYNSGTNGNNKNNKEKQTLIKEFTEDELTQLKTVEGINIDLTPLSSNTKYILSIEATAKQGSVEENVGIDYDLKEFITLKKSAIVEATNLLVTSNSLNFDIRIQDTDQAILDNRVRIEFRDQNKNLIDISEITTNSEVQEKKYEKLTENQYYTVLFYAEQYNEGSDNSTNKENFLLKSFTVYTEPGIEGKIQLNNLLRKTEGKNLIDVESEVKWFSPVHAEYINYWDKYYDSKSNTLSLKSKSSTRYYVYDLSNYANQQITISFKVKVDKNISGFRLLNGLEANDSNYIWLSNEINPNTASDFILITKTLTLNPSGYIGFCFSTENGTTGYVYLQNLQIELGGQATKYENFKGNLQADMNISLKDARNEIETNDYYIRIYKNNNQINEIRYTDFENLNNTKSFDIDGNSDYKFELLVKIKNKYYSLSTQEFTTKVQDNSNVNNNTDSNTNTNESNYNALSQVEIKGIKNEEEYLKIQPKGNYLILNNLDLKNDTNKYTFYNIPFQGNVDFNGKKVTLMYGHNLFNVISKNSTIKNIELDVCFETIEKGYWSSCTLFNNNYGTISNLKINVVESYAVKNSRIDLIGWINYGTIDKFIVDFKQPIYGETVNGGVQGNYGNIRNGYVYGSDMYSYGSWAAEVAGENYQGATIENIFVLSSIAGKPSWMQANISNNNYGTIRNVYSYGTGILTRNTNVTNNYGIIENSYYFGEKAIPSEFDVYTTKLALKDFDFQNKVLNSWDAYNISEPLLYGYYPQLKLNDCMPAQDFIALPTIENEDLVDVLNSEVLEENTNSAKIKVTVHNPNGEKIKALSINNIDNEIISQQNMSASENTNNTSNNAKSKLATSIIGKNNKTELILELKNPRLYVSKYSIMSITTESAYGLDYTRKYAENEKNILVSLFKEVNSISDWKEISKSPYENFKLTQDLDFINSSTDDVNIDYYDGVLDGNGHKISNINISKPLINQFLGDLKNLYVSNFHETTTLNNIGLIGKMGNDGKVDNVHINNMVLESNSTAQEYMAIGGIVSNTTNFRTIIQNSSVTNLEVKINKSLNNIIVGGISGDTYSTQIANCFVQNINFAFKNYTQSKGIGGIAGTIAQGSITNCYAQGKIDTIGQNIGGIIGINTNGSISNCLNLVNIYSSSDIIGGIIGYDISKVSKISNNLSIGNLYSSLNSNYIGSIYGRTEKDLSLLTTYETSKNYAWEKEKINGSPNPKKSSNYLSFEDKGFKYLNTNELLDSSTYTNILGWDDNWNYDSSKINSTNNHVNNDDNNNNLISTIGTSNNNNNNSGNSDSNNNTKNILPKLNNTEKSQLLPNQVDNILTEEDILKIQNVEATKVDANHGTVRISIYNPSHLQITGITVENMNVEIDKNQNNGDFTYLDLAVTANKYYDSYRISEIMYINPQNNGENQDNANISNDINNVEKVEIESKIPLQFWKDIEKIEDWQAIDSFSAQNYKLTNDLDLSNVPNPKTYVSLGRLDGNGHKIYNFNPINITTSDTNTNPNTDTNTNNLTSSYYSQTGSTSKSAQIGSTVGQNSEAIENLKKSKSTDRLLIKEIRTELKNITFENIHINSRSETSDQAGIIGFSSANIENVNFENCGVYSNSTYTGMIAYNTGLNAKNINLNNITIIVTGFHTQIGGFMGVTYDDNIQYVSGNNINVYCESGSNHVGGLFGEILNRDPGDSMPIPTTKYFNISNSYIIGNKSQTGGIAGVGRMSNSHVINTYVEGKDMVGGMSGNFYSTRGSSNRPKYNIVENSTVVGKTNVGGMCGLANFDPAFSYVVNSQITGLDYNVGGMFGKFQAIYSDYLGVKNCVVSAGNYAAGGIAGWGASYSFANIFIENAKITANNQVGGLVGIYSGNYVNSTATTTRNVINANIKANVSEAGGLFGYFQNQDQDKRSIKTFSSNIFAKTTVTAKTDVNSFIGKLDKKMLYTEIPADYKSNYLDINLIGTENVSYYLEGFLDYAQSFWIYEGSTQNGTLASNDNTLSSKNIAKISDIYNYYWWHNNGFVNWIFDLDIITSDQKYPRIKHENNQASQYEEGVDLPKKEDGVDNDDENNNQNYSTNNTLEYPQNYSLQLAKTDEVENPLKIYEYNGTTIKIYKKYSIINGQKQPFIYLVKNGRLSVFDANLDLKINNDVYESNNDSILPFQVVIDFYNGNEYQTFLAEDGKLYDLKTPLKYPKDFVNKGISEIKVEQANSGNSTNTVLTVNYENGAMVKFNYVTGEVLESKEASQKESIVNYIKNNLFNTSALYSNLQDKYNASKELKEKLEKEPIENYLSKQNKTQNNNNSNLGNLSSSTNETFDTQNNVQNATYNGIQNNYIIAYNSAKNNYEVYKESSLLNYTSSDSSNSSDNLSSNSPDNANEIGESSTSNGSNNLSELDNSPTQNNGQNQEDKKIQNWEENQIQANKQNKNQQENATQIFQSETAKIESNPGLKAHYLQNVQINNSNNNSTTGVGWIYVLLTIIGIGFILLILKAIIVKRFKK